MSKRTTKTICTGIDDFGRGIVHIDDTTCFVDNLLPGEEADVTTVFKYGKLSEAYVEKRYSNSKDRIRPACKYSASCGGCQLMHLSYEAQLEYKREKVKSLLHKFTHIDFDVLPTIPVKEPIRFRNKVQKPIRYNQRKKRLEAGFYEKETHSLVSIDDCLMETELSNRITNELLLLFRKYRYEAYDEDRQTGLIRHILIKTSTDLSQALVTLIVTDSRIKGIKEFAKDLIKRVPQVQGLVLNINARATNVILGEKNVSVYGRTHIMDKIFDKSFLVSSQSFYQTNSHQIETLYGKAIEFADPKSTDIVLDAYCGTGTIGLCFADRVKTLTGVEIVPDAVKDAILNAKINRIGNARFINMDCTKYLMTTKDSFDLIIMDPPRRGSTPDFINAVKQISPRKVIYVSCDPVTLARDLNMFIDKYEIKIVQPVDMFPNTSHVETICLLCRKDLKKA